MSNDSETRWTRDRLLDLYDKTSGEAWEPRNPQASALLELIEMGYVKRCDMFCMFEAFKDSGVKWTDAGHAALAGIETGTAETEDTGSVPKG